MKLWRDHRQVELTNCLGLPGLNGWKRHTHNIVVFCCNLKMALTQAQPLDPQNCSYQVHRAVTMDLFNYLALWFSTERKKCVARLISTVQSKSLHTSSLPNIWFTHIPELISPFGLPSRFRAQLLCFVSPCPTWYLISSYKRCILSLLLTNYQTWQCAHFLVISPFYKK